MVNQSGSAGNQLMNVKVLYRAAADHYRLVAPVFYRYVGLFCDKKMVTAVSGRVDHFRRNLFSIFFDLTYSRLGFSECQRQFFGVLNNCFRMKVTGVDNLLDGDDRHYLHFRQLGGSPAMKSVIDILLAEQIIAAVLMDYREQNIGYHAEEIIDIQKLMFRRLLEVGINEAEAEQARQTRLSSSDIIKTVHHIKSGKLFTLPYILPQYLSRGANAGLNEVEQSMYDFGIGCQLLDDIADLNEDYRGAKPNYVAALVRDTCGESLLKKAAAQDRLVFENRQITEYYHRALREADRYLRGAFTRLNRCIPELDHRAQNLIIRMVFSKLGISRLYRAGTRHCRVGT